MNSVIQIYLSICTPEDCSFQFRSVCLKVAKTTLANDVLNSPNVTQLVLSTNEELNK